MNFVKQKNIHKPAQTSKHAILNSCGALLITAYNREHMWGLFQCKPKIFVSMSFVVISKGITKTIMAVLMMYKLGGNHTVCSVYCFNQWRSFA